MTEGPRDVQLSIVSPLYNERAIVDELVARVRKAADATGLHWEYVLSDDGSSDGTRELIQQLADEDSRIRPLLNPENLGQYGATVAGLRAATGALVCAIDGDLQDPPELIPLLVEELTDELNVVYAVKHRRQDVAWFLAGQRLYHLGLRLAERPFPPGAGSYLLARAPVVARVTALAVEEANLGVMVSLTGAPYATVSYEKAPRYDGFSRVGAKRLAREALASWGYAGVLDIINREGTSFLAGVTGGAGIMGLVLRTWIGLYVALSALLAAGALIAFVGWAKRLAPNAAAIRNQAQQP